jgi:hypothetical protein
MKELAVAIGTAGHFRRVELPLHSPIRTSANKAFAREKQLLSSLLDHLLLHFDEAEEDTPPPPPKPKELKAEPMPPKPTELTAEPGVAEVRPMAKPSLMATPYPETTSDTGGDGSSRPKPRLTTVDESLESAYTATHYQRSNDSRVESTDTFYMGNLDGTDDFYPEPTMNSIDTIEVPLVKRKHLPQVSKGDRDEKTTDPKSFALFVTTLVDDLIQVSHYNHSSMLRLMLMIEPIHSRIWPS